MDVIIPTYLKYLPIADVHLEVCHAKEQISDFISKMCAQVYCKKTIYGSHHKKMSMWW